MSTVPLAEWGLHAAHIAVLDVIRDRGEPDGDTASECLRVIFATHTPHGRAALAASLILGGSILYRHLCKPLGDPS